MSLMKLVFYALWGAVIQRSLLANSQMAYQSLLQSFPSTSHLASQRKLHVNLVLLLQDAECQWLAHVVLVRIDRLYLVESNEPFLRV